MDQLQKLYAWKKETEDRIYRTQSLKQLNEEFIRLEWIREQIEYWKNTIGAIGM